MLEITCLPPFSLQNNVLLTGGEDSRINTWPNPPLPSDFSMPDLNSEGTGVGDDSMDVDMDTAPSRKRELDWGMEGGGKLESVCC